MSGKIEGLLLDSVILIDHFNGIVEATDFIEKNQRKNLFISVITRAEVLTGFANPQQLLLAKKLLDNFKILTISKEDTDLAADLRREFRWKLPDALQAAIAKNHQLKLVTRNTKDFQSKKHKFVNIPYTI